MTERLWHRLIRYLADCRARARQIYEALTEDPYHYPEGDCSEGDIR